MRLRKQELGDRNIVGVRIERKRRQLRLKQKDFLVQLQIKGVDINSSALSKIEGQHRIVTDKELVAMADVLGVSIDYLVGKI